MQFSHLHCHTQFSLLDGAADIKRMFKKAQSDNMPAVAITDHGNMFGVFDFVANAGKFGIKPIVGCEFYMVEDRHKKTFSKENKDTRCHQLMLAKNAEGYKNLTKLCSLGYVEGMYSKYPRIDKELVLKYHKGLIATTCCLGAIVPRTILRKSEEEAEKEFKWWLDLFGEDYYVELQRHNIPDQIRVNEMLLKFAIKHDVKIIASNDSHYVERDDANAHDILLCINTNEKQATPKSKDFSDEEGSKRGTRFAFANDEFYFKSTAEMTTLFKDLPQAIDNTNEIVSKCEKLDLKKDILLPNFPVPTEFKIHDDDVLNQWEFLKHLTYEGAKIRYGEISIEVQERIDFELFTIRTMGFAGYFLIVSDFIKEGRNMGVFVGPGRGSAAGSVVAYCTGITNIDPIKYNLLFERFLNPDRKSMPDIDTDFDDEGRQKVIDYVVGKYGKTQVAAIVTYGTMAAKMSIKDVARVLDLPLQESNALAKLVPDKPGISLNRVMKAPVDGEGGLKDKENLAGDDLENCRKLRELLAGSDKTAEVLKEALVLEGSVRNTGIHAAGIIIAPEDISNILPVCVSKESALYVTQFEGKIIEDAGVIKMDFLGLRNLTIMRDCLKLIEQNHGEIINLDTLLLDDEETYKLYQRGETNGTFQFESPGMQKYLKDLKPDRFGDLIAMNALYRPGPIEYIPNFIRRKHGTEAIQYDLPEMEEYLAETYGITVYQEQVMLLSQKLAGFTKGDADTLRKAMGKKQLDVLNKMKSKFMNGATAKGHPADKLEKIWTDWEAFASYAFNKSHSTCYALVAYQTAWLKTHYLAEYMAALLTSTLGNIEKTTFYMEESKRMGLKVLGPDINESEKSFAVNKKGEIRFGLGAIKGTGDAAVESIREERSKGRFTDIFDFATRVNLRTVNKKTIESLAYAGAFDEFKELHRSQYFHDENGTFIEKLIRFANKFTEDQAASQVSLFGDSSLGSTEIAKPKAPPCEEWTKMDKLRSEKEVVGVYISGHPLDDYRLEVNNFCNSSLDKVLERKNNEATVAGIVTKFQERFSKNGNPFISVTLEDYEGSLEIAFFGEDYAKFKGYINQDMFLFLRGKVQNRWNRPDEWEFKVAQIQFLGELRDKLCKSILIEIPMSKISETLVGQLETAVQQNPGTCSLFMKIKDSEHNIDLTLLSRKNKVAISNELIATIEGTTGLNYQLN